MRSTVFIFDPRIVFRYVHRYERVPCRRFRFLLLLLFPNIWRAGIKSGPKNGTYSSSRMMERGGGEEDGGIWNRIKKGSKGVSIIVHKSDPGWWVFHSIIRIRWLFNDFHAVNYCEGKLKCDVSYPFAYNLIENGRILQRWIIPSIWIYCKLLV